MGASNQSQVSQVMQATQTRQARLHSIANGLDKLKKNLERNHSPAFKLYSLPKQPNNAFTIEENYMNTREKGR